MYITLFLANGAYGGVVANTVVNNWFRRKRGRALGIATAGISLSGVVVPITAMVLIQRWGMHDASCMLGVGIAGPASWPGRS